MISVTYILMAKRCELGLEIRRVNLLFGKRSSNMQMKVRSTVDITTNMSSINI